jgi:hypothetical protein
MMTPGTTVVYSGNLPPDTQVNWTAIDLAGERDRATRKRIKVLLEN